ncbi:MAG: hypothetical protein KGD64_10185 [Candidatus Heimdallarchaeota archaeon]|nr:hypothetical protein [Candidatus Heimdallarchaeota archaeon]
MKDISLPWIIAHRGSSGRYPENTLFSFKKSLEEGSDIIELDLQLTKDNEIVVFHDRTVDRIFQTNTGRRIKDFSLKKLRTMDAGSWFHESYKNERIPTLFQVLEEIPRQTSLILEIKSSDFVLIEKLLEALDNNGKNLGLGYISVRDLDTYVEISKLSDKYPIGLMQKNRTPNEVLEEIGKYQIQIVQIRWKNWSEENWVELKQTSMKTTAFFADNDKDFEFLVKKEVNGILTNFPAKLKKYLN